MTILTAAALTGMRRAQSLLFVHAPHRPFHYSPLSSLSAKTNNDNSNEQHPQRRQQMPWTRARLRIVSWNVALGELSKASTPLPNSWTRQRQWHEMRQEILLEPYQEDENDEEYDPDIIVLEQVMRPNGRSWDLVQVSPVLEEDDGNNDSNSNSNEEKNQWIHDDSKPDVIALQECPTPHWWSSHPAGLGLSEQDYQLVMAQKSHCGYTILLVRRQEQQEEAHQQSASQDTLTGHQCQMSVFRIDKDMAQQQQQQPTIPASFGGIKLTMSSSSQSINVLIAAVHLEPFPEGAARRKEQMRAIRDYMMATTMTTSATTSSSIPTYLILVGDTNLRMAEEDYLERTLGWRDAFKTASCPIAHRNTWNSKLNRYHGPAAPRYACRYDRLYYYDNDSITMDQRHESRNRNKRNQHLTTESHDDDDDKVHVTHFQLIGNQPLTNPNHFLSDHFGLWIDLSLPIS